MGEEGFFRPEASNAARPLSRSREGKKSGQKFTKPRDSAAGVPTWDLFAYENRTQTKVEGGGGQWRCPFLRNFHDATTPGSAACVQDSLIDRETFWGRESSRRDLSCASTTAISRVFAETARRSRGVAN